MDENPRNVQILLAWGHMNCYRKTSFGNRSALGEKAAARLLTVSQTCRMQGRSALIYLGSAVSSHRRGVATPSPS
jgi:hypothetical protein